MAGPLMGRGQDDSLGEYCGPDTASSMFRILICLEGQTLSSPC